MSCSAGAGARSYAERHVAQLDAAAALGQRRRALRRHQPRLAVEQLEHARARGGRPLGQPERDAELAHRADQHQQVGVERREVADRERAAHHLPAADQQDHREAEVRQEADERVVERAQPGGDHRLVEHPPDAPAEPLELAFLGRERLHHTHAGHVLLDVRGQLRDPLLDPDQRRSRAAPVARRDEHDERHGRQRERGQPGLEEEHRDRGQHDRQRALDDEDEAVAEEEAHGLEVDRRARHQLARLLAREEAQLERLQVLVHPVAQVELDTERHAAPPPAGAPPTARRARARRARRRRRTSSDRHGRRA